eukprot:TRINITY_DN8817_c0_g1_i1.p1 TRINITY_DN8817_c0_g1~~TRINITY_DN8817_c0_g1_i1.p1  ORF type:complete len:299 (+),score=63.42 TRINITY_DN8817_c0_g1_i1:57-953(+)
MQADPNEKMWVRALCGGAASCTAEAFTLPMDTTKIRMQLAGELGSQTTKRGLVGTFVNIVKTEGVSGLYKGLTPGLLRQATYSSARMAVYEPLRGVFGVNAKAGEAPPLIAKILAGGSAGVIGAFIANPTDLVKIRMQADVSGTRYRNTLHAFSSILKLEGVAGMWKGVLPNMQRAFIVNAAELSTYDHCKQLIVKNNLMEDGTGAHAAASFLAGFVAAVCSTPVDLTKTRLMNQPVDANGKGTLYSGMLDCMTKTIKAEGFFGMYKGFFPTWLRIGPWAMVMFISFEQYRNFMNQRF